LPFRWARILSISPVVRHSLFNATVRRLDDDLDLPLTALAGLSLYEVSCPDDLTATIASLKGRTRWCTLSSGQLNCFRMAEQASYRAFDYLHIAARDVPSSAGARTDPCAPHP
jgi:hypothetical protein